MSAMRRTAVVGAGLVVSAVALWLVVGSVDLREVSAVLGRANPVPLAAILGVVAIQALVRAWRWGVVMPAREDGTRVRGLALLPPMLVGYLGNTVLPARLGEPMRAVLAARRERVGTTEALGSVAVERFLDVTMLAAVAFVAAVVVGGPGWAVQLLAVAAGAGLAGVVLLVTVGLQPLVRLAGRAGLRRRPRAMAVVERFVGTLGGPDRRRPLLTAAGLSVVAWFLDATSFWLAGAAVGADLPYAGAMLVSGVAVLGTAVPSAPGFVGTFELAAATTASALGVPAAEALALAVAVHATTLVPLAFGGAVSLVGMGVRLGDLARAAESRGRA